MEGVTILNSYEYLTNPSSIFLYLFWGFIFTTFALILSYLFIVDNYSSTSTVIFAIVAGALAVIFFCNVPEKNYETRYQVTVNDSVSMNEFQSKYEIIEVEGKIYTVRERVE